MLARKFRLQKRDLVRILKKGRVARFRDFLVRTDFNRTTHARFAVVISKKTIAKAHDRNRARRQVYQMLKENKGLWAGKPIDVAFFFRKFDLTEIDHTIQEIFKGRS